MIDPALSPAESTTMKAVSHSIPDNVPFRGEVFYDGQCPICLRGIARFGGLLARHGFQVKPLQTPGTLERTGRSRDALMRDMHVLTADGRVMAGVDAYLHIGEAIGWARPLAWLARLPGLRWLADRAYRAVADNRYRLARLDAGATKGAGAEDVAAEDAEADAAKREAPAGAPSAAASCPIGPRCSTCGMLRCRGTLRITFAGAAVWVALLIAALAGWAALGPIELMVLLGVLLIVPLGMPLVPLHVGWTLPVAAGAVVVSFLLPVGWAAGAAAAPWLAFTLMLAIRSLLAARKGPLMNGGPVSDRSFSTALDVSTLARAAAPLYLPVGAAWFVASRAGITPMGFAEPIVLLTAMHFHFAGFAAVLFCGSMAAPRHSGADLRARESGAHSGAGLRARESVLYGSRPARLIHAVATLAVIIGTPLLAVGFVTSVWLKLVAAILLTGGLTVICGQVLRRLHQLQPSAAALVGIASTSAIVAAALALLYVGGETQGQEWISIPAMAASHGLLNGLGFAACGLTGCRIMHSPRSRRCLTF